MAELTWSKSSDPKGNLFKYVAKPSRILLPEEHKEIMRQCTEMYGAEFFTQKGECARWMFCFDRTYRFSHETDMAMFVIAFTKNNFEEKYPN